MPRSVGFSVRKKLSREELHWLKDTFNIDLIDMDHLMALEELELAAAALRKFEGVAETVQGGGGAPLQARWCSFCGEDRVAPGGLAQSPRGTMICIDCAKAAVTVLSGTSGAT